MGGASRLWNCEFRDGQSARVLFINRQRGERAGHVGKRGAPDKCFQRARMVRGIERQFHPVRAVGGPGRQPIIERWNDRQRNSGFGFNLKRGEGKNSIAPNGGKVGIGTTFAQAVLQLGAGTTTANSAPLKFTSGPTLTTPEAGAVEYDGTSVYYTDNSISRHTLATADSLLTGLTGDVTASGIGVATATVSHVNGVSYPASPTTNTVPVVTGSNTVTYEKLPNAALANSSVTIGSTSISLGATATSLSNLASVGFFSGSATTTVQPSTATATAWTLTLPNNSGFSGFALTTDGAGNTSWTNTGNVGFGSANQLAYYSSAGTSVTGLATAASSVLLTNGSSTPAWSPLSSDNFTQYALLAGRSGGQSMNGGTAPADNLTLDSTSNATKGNILMATSGGNVGMGIMTPPNLLSVSPVQYSAGTASQSGTAVTGVGTSWTVQMVGSELIFANGISAGTITAFTNTTSVTVSTSQTVSSQGYTINNPGLNVAISGNVGIGTVAPSAPLHVQTSSAMTNGTIEAAVYPAVNGYIPTFYTNRLNGPGTSAWVWPNQGDLFGGVYFQDDGNTDAAVVAVAAENHSATHLGSSISFRTTPDSSGVGMNEVMLLTQGGTLGIGTSLPSTVALLDVGGTIKSTVVTNSSPNTTAWDLSKGNVQSTTTACSGATWTLNNMSQGATYTIAVQPSSAHTGPCVFSVAGETVKYNPVNATPNGSTHVIYSLTMINSYVYVSWADGF